MSNEQFVNCSLLIAHYIIALMETNLKKHPNHQIYLQVLRQMTPEQRLTKAFELSDFAKLLFIHGLKQRFPDLSAAEFKELLLRRLDKCHNRNY